MKSLPHTTETSRDLPTICQLLFSLDVGGAEMLARDIAEAGAGEFRFVFACLDSIGQLGAQMQASGHVVESLGRKPGIDLRCARRLAGFCRRHRVDLIHAHLCGPYRHAGVARLFGLSCPILVTEHGREFPDSTTWRRRAANRLLLRRHDRFIGVGHFLREALEINEGIPPSRIEVIHNGRDLARYSTTPEAQIAARRQLRFADETFVLMQVARLSRIKDHLTALRVIAILATRYPTIRHVIVGDGPERPAIESALRDLTLQEHVIMLGPRDDVSRLLPAADVFLLTSLSEAIPLTLIEAMAAEIPCVASRVGGIPEVIAEGETGLLAEPGNAESFADSIEHLIVDEETRLRMASRSRQRAEQFFGRERMQQAYYDLYRQMLKLPVQPAP